MSPSQSRNCKDPAPGRGATRPGVEGRYETGVTWGGIRPARTENSSAAAPSLPALGLWEGPTPTPRGRQPRRSHSQTCGRQAPGNSRQRSPPPGPARHPFFPVSIPVSLETSLPFPAPLSLQWERSHPNFSNRVSTIPFAPILFWGRPHTHLLLLPLPGRCLYFYWFPLPPLRDRPHYSWLPLNLHRAPPFHIPTPTLAAYCAPLARPRPTRSPRAAGAPTSRTCGRERATPCSLLACSHPHVRGAPSAALLPGRSGPLDPNFLERRGGDRKEEGTRGRGADGGAGRRPPQSETRRTCSNRRSAERPRNGGPMAGGRAGVWSGQPALGRGSFWQDFRELAGARRLRTPLNWTALRPPGEPRRHRPRHR